MPGPADIKAQILLQLRADTEGFSNKVNQEFDRVIDKVKGFTRELGESKITAEEFTASMKEIGSSLNFWGKLRDEAQKFSQAEIAEMDRIGKAHADLMEKMEAEAARAAQAEADAFAALATKHEAFMAKEAEAAAQAAQREAEEMAALAAKHEAMLAKMATDAEKEAAEEEKAALRRIKASNQATAAMLADAEKINQVLAREAEEAQRAAQKEAEAFAEAATKHEQMLAKEAEAERKNAQEIAAARASLANQKYDAVRAETDRQDAILITAVRLARLGNEQEHLNGIIAEGAQQEAAATRVVITHANAYRDLALATTAVRAGLNPLAAQAIAHDKAMQQSASGTRAFSYGLLNVAHAMQDAQYGFGAVLNNIPLVAQAFGAGPGLAGTVMIAGVALNTLIPLMGDWRSAVGAAIDPTERFTGTLKGMKAMIEAKEGKYFKVEVDYAAIENGHKALEKFTKAIADYEAGRETKLRKSVAEEAKRATEAAGGTAAIAGIFAKEDADRGINRGAASDQQLVKDAPAWIQAAFKQRDAANDPISRAFFDTLGRRYQSQKDEAERRIKEANEEHAKKMAGLVQAGDEATIKTMKAIVARRPDFVNAGGRDAIGNLPATEGEAYQKELREKLRKVVAEAGGAAAGAVQQANDEANQAREAIQQAEVNRHVSAFSNDKALGETTQGQIRELVKGGTLDPEELKQKLFDATEKVIGDTGAVPDGRLNDVTRGVLDKIVEKELAELAGIAAGAKTTIQQAAIDALKAAADKAAAKAKAAGEREAAKAQRGVKAEAKETKEENFQATAQFLGRRFPDTTPEQAAVGAKTFYAQKKGGDAQPLAEAKTQAKMLEFTIENVRVAASMGQYAGNAAMVITNAMAQLQAIQAQIAQAEMRLKKLPTRQGGLLQAFP